ncbi:MAG: peptidyl-prolyl cis-trans isomerase [Polyangiaceae bacterium]
MSRLSKSTIVSVFALTLAHASNAGMTADEVARRSAVVAKVGARTIPLGDLEDKLAAVPLFQRAVFGKTTDEVRANFLDEVLVADALVAEAATKEKFGERVDVRLKIARAKAEATLRATKAEVPAAATISKEEVSKYYDAHIDRFVVKERMQLWRIMVKTEAEAKEILELAKKDGTPKEFGRLAREKSLDKATYLRNGNLGFVAPDGAASEAGIRVAATLPAAASKVKDGEFVPQPIAEGEFFSVVWRRGSTPAKKQTVEQASSEIRDAIVREGIEKRTKDLLDGLRKKNVKLVDHAGLASFDIDVGDARIGVRKAQPGASASATGTPTPSSTTK